MPRRGTKFISEFLIPSLDSERFGELLKWADKKKAIFELVWSHKGSPNWSEEEVGVFVEWDKIKGHYQPKEKNYYSNCKQRFRALLYKQTIEGLIREVKKGDKTKKVYAILAEKKPRKKNSSESSDYSFDDLSSEDPSMDEIGHEVYDDDNVSKELRDHNYSCSKHLMNIEGKDQRDRMYNVETPILLSEFSEKKVLMERNSPYNSHENILLSKDMNHWNGILEDSMMDEDLYTSLNKVLLSAGNEGLYDQTNRDLQNRLDENKTPETNTEQFLFPTPSELIESFDYPFLN